MPMSAEERELLDLQTQLLEQARDATNSGNALNNLLLPIMLEQQGYNVIRAESNVANERYGEINSRIGELNTLFDGGRWDRFVNYNQQTGEVSLSSQGGMMSNSAEGRELTSAINEFNSLRRELGNTPEFSQRAGDIIDLELIEPEAGSAESLREENERLLLERQNSALRGELPVSPGLLSDLDQQEEDLRASLLENLGTGYETSSPGIEALAEFGERRTAIEEAARRDDMATAGGLANQMGGFLQSINSSRFGSTMAVGQMPFQGSSNLLNIANSAGGPLQYMQGNRALEFQMAQANNAPGLFESLLTQGAGTAMTFGLADIFDII